MSRLVRAFLLAGCVATFSVPTGVRAQANQECDGSITDVLKVVSELKAGNERADVERNFTLDGGLSFSKTTSRYVFMKCSLIKIDVEFSGENKSAELSPTDVVVHVSKPYLEYPFAD